MTKTRAIRLTDEQVSNLEALAAALNISGILLTFHFVTIGWIFFALSSPSASWQVILKLFGVQ